MRDLYQEEQIYLKKRDEAAKFRDKDLLRESVIEYHQKAIAQLTENVTSGKYLDDHQSYAFDVGAIQAHKASIELLESAEKVYTEAVKNLERVQGELNA